MRWRRAGYPSVAYNPRIIALQAGRGWHGPPREYIALTQLQADALVTLDANLARAVTGVVTVAPIEAL